ncbi:hypothetical protein [Chitiniphilus shinanonensis]|uniref:hypothetical protein n=1 Tax=Chitiniphilus shinanonensis TaxID=553088 RepID=UPI00304FF0B4
MKMSKSGLCLVAVLAGVLSACGGGGGDGDQPPVVEADTFARCMSELATLPDSITATPVALGASDPIAVSDGYDHSSRWLDSDGIVWIGTKDTIRTVTEFQPQSVVWRDIAGAEVPATKFPATMAVTRENYRGLSYDDVFAGTRSSEIQQQYAMSDYYSPAGAYLGYLETEASSWEWGFFFGPDRPEITLQQRDALVKDQVFETAEFNRYGLPTSTYPAVPNARVKVSYAYVGKDTVQTGLSGEITACKLNVVTTYAPIAGQQTIWASATTTENFWYLPTVNIVHRTYRQTDVDASGAIIFDSQEKRDLNWRVVDGIKYQMPRTSN